jgi:hemerythrin
MPFIVWKDSYRTHIQEIDAHHLAYTFVRNVRAHSCANGDGHRARAKRLASPSRA